MRVLTLGTFDLFHYGHVRFLRKCYRFGNELTVGLNADEFVEEYKGKRPVMSYKERETAIKEVFCDAEIYPNYQPENTIIDLIDLSKPDVIVIGSDWMRKDYLKQIGVTPEYLDEHNISLAYVPYEWTISSTEIKRRISNA